MVYYASGRPMGGFGTSETLRQDEVPIVDCPVHGETEGRRF